MPENGLRRAAVLAGLILVQAAFLGVGYNSVTVLLSAVIDGMGFLTSQMSVYYTIYTLASAVCVTGLTALFFKGAGCWPRGLGCCFRVAGWCTRARRLWDVYTR